MNVIFASSNKAKLDEYRRIIEYMKIPEYKLKLHSLSDLNINDFNVEETGETYEQNAMTKAKALQEYLMTTLLSSDVLDILKSGYCIMSDDSGIEVYALDNRPGIYSHRYAEDGHHCEKLVSELITKETDDTIAEYVTDVCLYFPGTVPVITCIESVVIGNIDLSYTDDKNRNNTGEIYDPVFIPVGSNECISEMSDYDKYMASRRTQLFKKVCAIIEALDKV